MTDLGPRTSDLGQHADLLASSAKTRIRAIRTLPGSASLAYALRRVLFTDPHAEVRCAAARRFGEVSLLAEVRGPRSEVLLQALADKSSIVRDAALRGLSRAPRLDGDDLDRVRACVAGDRVWWVRRTAIYTLAAVAGADEIPALTAALADPFWRVRHAAVRVLAVLGARDLDVRDAVIAAPTNQSALAFLRASWGPVAVEAPQRAASASRLPPALLDPDPAVVTARLASDPDVTPLALVELLCDPHVTLRELAVERLVASGDREALIAALDWLEAFQIPHVADTVEAMLDGLGDGAVPIAAHALARAAERPHAARWAIRWVVGTRFDELADAALAVARADRALRAGAVTLAETDELSAWACDEATASATLDAIACELHARGEVDALHALLAADAPRIRALQLDAHGRAGTLAPLHAALADAHHGPRAIATRYLVHTGAIDGLAQLADPDPAVREAAISPANAHAAVEDADPFVARAAIERLATTFVRVEAPPADAIAAAVRALAHPDPFVRARAAALAVRDDAALPAICAQLADPDDGARAGATEALAVVGRDIANRLRALVATPGTPGTQDLARAMALAFLHRDLEDVDAVIAALPVVASAPAPVPQAAVRSPQATVPRRAFGRAGFAVAPLAISGANDLDPRTLQLAANAGVDLFFWEPAYGGLTKFLRTSPASRVIAGSYHAEPESIEADVDRALRTLRRDSLDAFLLFWSRSEARIDRAAYAVLARLKERGKIRAAGFSTHHRDLARDAIAASPWDVVMIRHSAAHPGIETDFLPAARAAETAVLTFSALCYGRMLAGAGAPSAAECYRYSLAQPGVTACISAPRRADELLENLAALREPSLPAEQLAALRTHGLGVRAESQRFNALLRQPTRDAAAAARDLLAAELPPAEVVEARVFPAASKRRGARTNLSTARRQRR